jgi:hypothetical protein
MRAFDAFPGSDWVQMTKGPCSGNLNLIGIRYSYLRKFKAEKIIKINIAMQKHINATIKAKIPTGVESRSPLKKAREKAAKPNIPQTLPSKLAPNNINDITATHL